MADNVNVTGSGSIPIEAKDISGVYRQYVSLSGPTGAYTDVVGTLTETAPATDTASSGLNGRLQRIAQRLTSLIALVPASLGGKTAANSFAVTTATDDPAGPAASVSRIVSAAGSTNATSAKASAGILKSVSGYNAIGSTLYLKFYNKASSPTVGTDTPVITIAMPPYGPFAIPLNLTMSTGIAYAMTTGSADSSTAALTAGDVLGLNVFYL